MHRSVLEEANLSNAEVANDQLATVGSLRYATMVNGSRYDGRFNLAGDLSAALRENVDVGNTEAMAEFYGVSVDDYNQGKEQAREHPWWFSDDENAT